MGKKVKSWWKNLGKIVEDILEVSDESKQKKVEKLSKGKVEKPLKVQRPKISRSDLPDLSQLKPPVVEEAPQDENEEDDSGEIVNRLQSAVEKWKETGETGLNLKPPVRMRERVGSLLTSLEGVSSKVLEKLRKELKNVSDKSWKRVQEAQEKGEKLDVGDVVREEWNEVLEKLHDKGTQEERAEIENIYKQLEEK